MVILLHNIVIVEIVAGLNDKGDRYHGFIENSIKDRLEGGPQGNDISLIEFYVVI